MFVIASLALVIPCIMDVQMHDPEPRPGLAEAVAVLADVHFAPLLFQRGLVFVPPDLGDGSALHLALQPDCLAGIFGHVGQALLDEQEALEKGRKWFSFFREIRPLLVRKTLVQGVVVWSSLINST